VERLGVRARGGGGAEERIELGPELESDLGAGAEKTPTGGALPPALEIEKERGSGASGSGRGEEIGPRAREGRKEKKPRAGNWAGLPGEKEERERRRREPAGLGPKGGKEREGKRKRKSKYF
jgi:hypothetical protein